MIPIFIISAFVLISFIFFVVFIVKIIVKKINKVQVGKPLVIKTIVSGIVCALLGIANAILFILVLYNGDPLLDKIMSKGADAVSKTLAYTWQGVQENWNQETLDKAKLIDISATGYRNETKDDDTTYTVELLLDNKSKKDLFLTYYELQDQKLIFFTDKDDIFYGGSFKDAPANSIPLGKSRLTISAQVPKIVELVKFHFTDRIIELADFPK